MKNYSKEIALIAPPWWLIPSKDIVTATEHLVEDYSFHLRKSGYIISIFSRKKDFTDKGDILDTNGYDNKHIYTRVSSLDRKFLKKRNIFFYFLYILKVSLKVRRMGIRKILVFQTFTFCFWLKLINPKSKILFHIGGHELSKKENYFNYGYIPDSLARRVIPSIDTIICVSKRLKENISERFPDLKRKCKYIYAGIDTKIFKRKDTKTRLPVIIFAGRVVPEKGVGMLVDVFKNLKSEFNDLELYIVGESIGPNVPSDFDSIFDLEGIKRFGLLTRRDVAKILRKGSVFVYPVIMEETFGLAPIEAMASGLVTVVSDSDSGYREIIKNGFNGYYFRSEDIKDLQRVLKNILNSLENHTELEENAINTVKEELNWDRCVKETMELFCD